MERKRDGFVPVGDLALDLPVPVPARRGQARHFTHPVPIDVNTLRALTRLPLGLDLYLWLTYRTFGLTRPLRLSWPRLYRQFGSNPARSNNKNTVNAFRTDCLRELKKRVLPS